MIVDIAGNAVDLDLEPGDILTDLVLIGRVQRADEAGESAVLYACTDHTDSIVKTGLLTIGNSLININTWDPVDDDE